MKTNYLWDKSGEADPEIEHLEQLLQTFRHAAAEAPALPVAAIAAVKPVFKRKIVANSPRRMLITAAAAACLLIAAAVLTLLLTVRTRTELAKSESANRIEKTKINPPETNGLAGAKSGNFDSKNAETDAHQKTGASELLTKRLNARLMKRSRANRLEPPQKNLKRAQRTNRLSDFSLKQTFAAAGKTPKSVLLTDEEQFAYNQLMRALQITSGELNRVKQKAQSRSRQAEKNNQRS